jgi:agarase
MDTPFASLQFDAEAAKLREDAFPRDYDYVTCFDNWPPFMALTGTRIKNHRGTPADFAEAARLASATIGWQRKVQGKPDHWWEVKNESTITEEWVLHAEEGVDSWGKLAEFHNVMAETIHRDHPEVLVGGPTSAWMALHHGGFDLARKQMRFMDETKGHLDFYSHHFYEGKQLVLSEGDTFSGGYLMGRLEGCLDLLRNHMVLTDNIRPMIISETGTLFGRTTEMGIWLNTKNMSSYLMRYMDHPDKIDLINLWLIPYIWWDKNAHTLFNKVEDGKLVMDQRVGYFLDLWQDFRGDRLPIAVATRQTNVHVQSVLDGQTVWVAINNLNPHRIAADISVLTADVQPVRIEQVRLYFDRGQIHFETVERRDLKALPVAVEETSLVKITLDRVPVFGGTLDENTFYGDKVIQPTGEPVAFRIRGPKRKPERACLRICLSRDGGFGEKLSVLVNGKQVARNVTITPIRKSGNYWGYHTLSVPAKVVRPENEVTVMMPEAGGTITSVALIATELQRGSTP